MSRVRIDSFSFVRFIRANITDFPYGTVNLFYLPYFRLIIAVLRTPLLLRDASFANRVISYYYAFYFYYLSCLISFLGVEYISVNGGCN